MRNQVFWILHQIFFFWNFLPVANFKNTGFVTFWLGGGWEGKSLRKNPYWNLLRHRSSPALRAPNNLFSSSSCSVCVCFRVCVSHSLFFLFRVRAGFHLRTRIRIRIHRLVKKLWKVIGFVGFSYQQTLRNDWSYHVLARKMQACKRCIGFTTYLSASVSKAYVLNMLMCQTLEKTIENYLFDTHSGVTPFLKLLVRRC